MRCVPRPSALDAALPRLYVKRSEGWCCGLSRLDPSLSGMAS